MSSKKSAPASHPAVTPSTPSLLLGGSQSKEISKTNGSTRARVTDALQTPRPIVPQKRNPTPPILQELIVPDNWDDEDDAIVEYDDSELAGFDPLSPTKEKPGSKGKVLMLKARFAAGLPLWNDNDVTDHGPSTKEGELSAIEHSDSHAKGRPSDIVRQGGLESETGEETIDDDEDDADEL